MSGVKDYNVSLRQSEYNRLMNSAREVDRQAERQRTLQIELENARRQMQEISKASDRRQTALESSLDLLSNEMQQKERLFQKQLKDQQTKMKQELSGLDAKMEKGFNDINNRMKQGFEKVDKRLNQQREEYTKLHAEHAKELAKINQQNKKENELASQWLNDNQVILNYIAQNQQHQKFAPHELDKLQLQLANLEQNIKDKVFQAAISTGQDLYQKAVELRTNIQLSQIEWDSYYQLAVEDARRLLAELDTQSAAKWMMETEQGMQELDAEVDYWTDNGLTTLKKEVNDSIDLLNQADFSIDQLKQHSAETENKETRLQQLLERAKERLIASQLRSDMADDLLENLEKSGWQLTEEAWQGEAEDGKGWKNSLHMKLVDQGNNEMVTVIYPVDHGNSGAIENKIEFAYYPHNNNDLTFHSKQTAQLGQMLTGMNLDSDGKPVQLKCVSGHERTVRGDAKRYDFAQIRKSGHI